MKKIYFILVVLWLSVSSVSAQSVFWGKTYKINVDANTMATYSVDKAGNAEYIISVMEKMRYLFRYDSEGKTRVQTKWHMPSLMKTHSIYQCHSFKMGNSSHQKGLTKQQERLYLMIRL